MFILLIKASLVVCILLAFYKLVLEKESFFSANRFYLLACLCLAFVLPFLVLPKIIVHQGYVDTMLESKSSSYTASKNSSLPGEQTPSTRLHNDTISNKKMETSSSDYMHDKEDIANTITKQNTNKNDFQKEAQTPTKGFGFWIFWVYIFGVIVLSVNFISQILSIYFKIYKSSDKIKDEDVVIVNMTSETEPCSFLNYIFINPSAYDFNTYEQVLAHEKIHIRKKHTLDLLLSEMAVIIMWFNPFVWLFRKEVEKNLEYQTDDLLLKEDTEIKEDYQMNLLKIACNTSPLAITTNYNQSLIKQRILKMNSKKSNAFNYWKYAFSLPILFILLLTLNKPNSIRAQALNSMENSIPKNETPANETTSDSIDTEKAIEEKPTENTAENNANQKTKPKKNPSISQSKSMSSLIADCEEFEKAVARGDLERVKEILKTLDPDCLKLKKNEKSNLKSVKELVSKNKEELGSQAVANKKEVNTKKKVDQTVCEDLEEAVRAFDQSRARRILLEEDLSCLKNAKGGPISDEKLLKGLLRYHSELDIGRDQIIRIDDIGFTIGLPEKEGDCNDSNYLLLCEAIKTRKEEDVRNLLATRNFVCPLNEDGYSNDFPFIKELMKYTPKISFNNGESITIYGIGIEIDMKMFSDKDQNSKSALSNGRKDKLLDDIENILPEVDLSSEDLNCLDLLQFVMMEDYSATSQLLKSIQPDCYHRTTVTESLPSGMKNVSDETVTPLILAANSGNGAIVELLLNNGADPNYSGFGDLTPLMVAALSGNLRCVQLIVNAKADLNQKNKYDQTALDLAYEDNNEAIINYLNSKGAKSTKE